MPYQERNSGRCEQGHTTEAGGRGGSFPWSAWVPVVQATVGLKLHSDVRHAETGRTCVISELMTHGNPLLVLQLRFFVEYDF